MVINDRFTIEQSFDAFNIILFWKPINDIRKHRGNNPIQDSPVKKSAIRLFNENTTPDTVSTETELS
jgi:hypothetical protein